MMKKYTFQGLVKAKLEAYVIAETEEEAVQIFEQSKGEDISIELFRDDILETTLVSVQGADNNQDNIDIETVEVIDRHYSIHSDSDV
jgi:hypothetical protein